MFWWVHKIFTCYTNVTQKYQCPALGQKGCSFIALYIFAGSDVQNHIWRYHIKNDFHEEILYISVTVKWRMIMFLVVLFDSFKTA